MNKFIIAGRLTDRPDIRDGSTKVATVTVAVDRSKKDEADFIRMTMFGTTAEFAETYLRQGSKYIFEGRIQNDNYTKADGTKVYGYSFIADRVEFCEKKGENIPDEVPTKFMQVDDDGLPWS